MEGQRRQVTPGRVTAEQFDAAGLEHQFEQQPPQQPEHQPRGRRGAGWSGPQLQRGQEDRQEAGFQQQDVPLETEKLVTDRRQRKVDQPQQEQARGGRNANHEQDGQRRPGGALKPQEAVARLEPA